AGNVLSLVCKVTNDEPEPLPEDTDADIVKLVAALLSKSPEGRPSASAALRSPCLQQTADLLLIYRSGLEGKFDRIELEDARAQDQKAGIVVSKDPRGLPAHT
ncbi:unnamed protein product, partial [Prorocentrum cordatum]